MKTGLRFDRVALGVMRDVRDALGDLVPNGSTLVFTLTAPIRLPAKTAAAIEDAARKALTRRSSVDVKQAIHGNRVRIALVEGRASHAVIGLVHNPEIAADLLLDVTRSVLAS